MKFPQNNIIDNWLNKNGNPEIARLVEKNLALTEKINSILKERGIKKGEFAKMLGKNPSEVSKWLSGAHNLTLKSINKMEFVLGVDLINIEPITEVKYVYLGLIQGGELENAMNDYEDSNYNIAM
ncbi:helix-turn-helix transcriptional regulator [Oceanihabitans sp. IOP_32]|uniref:helix-turn-helix domain-containing protein n=1 Tax=Oceanihabitans sp. IOP_32 TaxID=2529032 RepID=UPI0012936C41|nr:helix-turn-helix transcriptional regulator [Oceanihabitans sp. IOP_32]QFZ53335.1 helix-turn-helix transcriptional regulator [Oceanihabitans sp. IOP_32]